jgi:predicted SnoaL-like aldol condensation-catalyzing enzyme
MKTLLFISLVVFLGLSASNSYAAASNKDKAMAVLKSLETRDLLAPEQFISDEKYIQHNLGAGDGKAGFMGLFQIPNVAFKANTVRAFTDGDYVFTHTAYDFFGPKVGFDIFRFENGTIVEHWDNLAEKAEPNPSGHTQLDGPTHAVNPESTEANKALVKDFVETILIGRQFEKLADYFDGDNYIQHNPNISDGLSGLGQALEAMAKEGIAMVYTANHMMLGEGNFVLPVSEGEFGGQHVAFYDLFQVENGKIAEHWDVIEPIPPREQWKNQNGKF